MTGTDSRFNSKPIDKTPNILFVCTYRGGRSQIAHVYAKRHGSEIVDSYCACFDPSSISPDFVKLVSTFGLEIDSKSPLSVFDEKVRAQDYEYVVCMCSSVGTEMCSLFRTNIDRIFPNAKNRVHWDILDFGACKDSDKGFKACALDTCETIEKQVVDLIETIAASKVD